VNQHYQRPISIKLTNCVGKWSNTFGVAQSNMSKRGNWLSITTTKYSRIENACRGILVIAMGGISASQDCYQKVVHGRILVLVEGGEGS
jgi:hypothetical protein